MKVLVFQHVAREILGTLNPLLKEHRFRVRYINFERHPDIKPSIEKYGGLIVLGGQMGVYEADKYTHIKVEMELIEQALKKNIPILGICLGAQILAHVLGAEVRKHTEKETGWCAVHLTADGVSDPLMNHFGQAETVFQMHGDTFDIPKSAVHLAKSKVCPSQAFRYGEKVYGLQFHLEVDEPMIHRWLKHPDDSAGISPGPILAATDKYMGRAQELSHNFFSKFIDLFDRPVRPLLLGSGHGKPRKPG